MCIHICIHIYVYIYIYHIYIYIFIVTIIMQNSCTPYIVTIICRETRRELGANCWHRHYHMQRDHTRLTCVRERFIQLYICILYVHIYMYRMTMHDCPVNCLYIFIYRMTIQNDQSFYIVILYINIYIVILYTIHRPCDFFWPDTNMVNVRGRFVFEQLS